MMEFYRANGLAINLSLVERAECDGANLLLYTTTGNVHRIPFDSAEEAKKAYEGLAPTRAPASRRKPKLTR